MKRRNSWILVYPLVILSLILAACAGATPQPNQPAQNQSQSTQAPAVASTNAPTAQAATNSPESLQATNTPAVTEHTGGNLVYVLPSDIASFDPQNTKETVSGMVNSQIFDYLTELQPDGSVGPGLAESWETSADKLTWTFHLRKGIKFQDGTPFNAEAVKINYDRVLNKDNALPSIQLLSGVSEVKVVDDYTLQIVTKEPFGPLPFHLSHYSLGIISPAALKSMTPEELAQKPVGTGPFSLVSYTPNESIVLKANPNYWGAKPHVDTITFKPAPEAATRSVLLQTGAADIVAKISPQDVASLNEAKGVHVDVEPFTRVIFIHMNEKKEPFGNVKVRQALSYAIDRQSIVKNILKGYASVATGPMGKGVFGYTDAGHYTYDPQKAKQLLADAGYPNGFSTTMWVPAGRYQGAEEAAQAVQAQLADIGVKVDIQVKEWSSLLSQIKKGPDEAQWDMLLLGFAPATNDADWQLYSQFNTKSWAPLSNNRSFYSNPEVDKLLDQGRFSTDQTERKAIYAKILKIIYQDAPELYLYQTTQIYGVSDKVSGLVYLPIDIQNLETVSKSP